MRMLIGRVQLHVMTHAARAGVADEAAAAACLGYSALTDVPDLQGGLFPRG